MAASAARRISGSSLRCTVRTVSSSPSPRMTEGREPSVTPLHAAAREPSEGDWPPSARAHPPPFWRVGSATPPRFNLGGPGSSAAGESAARPVPRAAQRQAQRCVRYRAGAASPGRPCASGGDRRDRCRPAAQPCRYRAPSPAWDRPSRCPPRHRRSSDVAPPPAFSQ